MKPLHTRKRKDSPADPADDGAPLGNPSSLPERRAKRRAREWIGGFAVNEKKQHRDAAPSEPGLTAHSPTAGQTRSHFNEKASSNSLVAQPRQTSAVAVRGVPAVHADRAEALDFATTSQSGKRSGSGGNRAQLPRVEYSSHVALQNGQFERPVVTVDDLKELNDPVALAVMLGAKAGPLVSYAPDVRVSLGEGGRELLRACLLLKQDGNTLSSLQGASVQTLLYLAHQAGLWFVVQRIVAERTAGIFSPLHLAFNQFKALQTRLRKELHTESMLITRAPDGSVEHVVYEPNKSLQIGKEGRSILKARLCRYIGHHQEEVAARLEAYGLGSLALKHATVPQLLAIAWVLNQWDLVVQVVRRHDDKRRLRKLAPKSAASQEADTEPLTHPHAPAATDKDNPADPSPHPGVALQTHTDFSGVFPPEHGQNLAMLGHLPTNGLSPNPYIPGAVQTLTVGAPRPENVSVDRLLRIVQSVDDPSCKDAPEVARQLLTELMRCVRLGLVSMPPLPIYQKLTAAARSLGVPSDVVDPG